MKHFGCVRSGAGVRMMGKPSDGTPARVHGDSLMDATHMRLLPRWKPHRPFIRKTVANANPPSLTAKEACSVAAVTHEVTSAVDVTGKAGGLQTHDLSIRSQKIGGTGG